MKEILISYSNNMYWKNGIQTLQATNLQIMEYSNSYCITNGPYCGLYVPKSEKNKEWLGRILRAIYSFMVDPYENFMHIHLTDDSYATIKRGKSEENYYIVNVEK